MRRLTGIELRRLLARPLTQLAVLAAVLVMGLVLFAFHDYSTPASAQERRSSRAAYEGALRDWEVNGPQQVASCSAQQAAQQADDPAVDLHCDRLAPTAASFGRTQPQLGDVWTRLVTGAAYLLMFLCFLVGAGFVATEFRSGAITIWLTFQPRRGLVHSSKVAAVTLGSLPFVALAMAVLVAGAFLITDRSGVAAMTSGQWSDLLGAGARATVLASLAGGAGAAMAVLVRHTAAVVAIVTTYLVIVENTLAGLVPASQPWLARLNVDAWIRHGTSYVVERCGSGSGGTLGCVPVERALTFTHSAVYLGVGLAILLVAAAAVFRRRDFT